MCGLAGGWVCSKEKGCPGCEAGVGPALCEVAGPGPQAARPQCEKPAGVRTNLKEVCCGVACVEAHVACLCFSPHGAGRGT